MAFILKVDGTKENIKLKDGKLTLEQMQKAVGGYVEHLTLPNGHMFLDEEGKLKGKQINETATLLTRGIVAGDDFIVGDVIICKENEIE